MQPFLQITTDLIENDRAGEVSGGPLMGKKTDKVGNASMMHLISFVHKSQHCSCFSINVAFLLQILEKCPFLTQKSWNMR